MENNYYTMEDPIDKTIDEILSCLGDEFVFESESYALSKHVLMFKYNRFVYVSKDYMGHQLTNNTLLQTRLDELRKIHNVENATYLHNLYIQVELNNNSNEYILK